MTILWIFQRVLLVSFQNIECYLKTDVDLIEDDSRLALDEHNSSFITFEQLPGFYTFKDLSEVLLRHSQLGFDGFNNSIDIKINDLA